MQAVPNNNPCAEALDRPRGGGAVLSMSLCVAVLIASEFMPVSLLTPIALDLGVTEGRAGLAISISGLFAVMTSLMVAQVTRNTDRKRVQSTFAALLVLSALTVALAPNYPVLMLGRALLGVAIGGFWSMSTAIVLRLVPEEAVPRALATLNAGNAIAATISAPVGAWLGDLIGWRGAFGLIVPVALLALVWQRMAMPSLPPRSRHLANPFRLLARRQVQLGMASLFLLFLGQFTLFTYLRPYLEGVVGLSVPMLSLMFLGLGLSGLAGTWSIILLLRFWLYAPLIGIPIIMATLALCFVTLATQTVAVCMLVLLWGFFGTAAPVGWGTWLAQRIADQAETGGGLQVAVIQLAITAGAAAGGLLFDALGWTAAFEASAFFLAGSSLTALLAALEHERRNT